MPVRPDFPETEKNNNRGAKRMDVSIVIPNYNGMKYMENCLRALEKQRVEGEPETEILVMALPAVADTAGILSRERIALLPREAIVVNVGRGSAIDQDALMEALNAGRIAGAALDVVVPEPLPKDHPLWSTRNLLLTPHISGNMSLGYTCDRNLDMFCRDLENYAAGRPLEHRVDRKRGY